MSERNNYYKPAKLFASKSGVAEEGEKILVSTVGMKNNTE